MTDSAPPVEDIKAERPVRVQLSRAKGWRMPANTVSVARPGWWGNPFYVNRWRGAEVCVRLFRESVGGCWSPGVSAHLPDAHCGYDQHREWLARWRSKRNELPIEAIGELRGKNLACWCKLDAPCHADVLLELANVGSQTDERRSRADLPTDLQKMQITPPRGEDNG